MGIYLVEVYLFKQFFSFMTKAWFFKIQGKLIEVIINKYSQNFKLIVFKQRGIKKRISIPKCK